MNSIISQLKKLDIDNNNIIDNLKQEMDDLNDVINKQKKEYEDIHQKYEKLLMESKKITSNEMWKQLNEKNKEIEILKKDLDFYRSTNTKKVEVIKDVIIEVIPEIDNEEEEKFDPMAANLAKILG